MIKNSNLTTVFKQGVKTLLQGNFLNGVHVSIAQKIDDENVPLDFKIDFRIVRKSKKEDHKDVYTVQFNDVDLIDSSHNEKPAEFVVFSEARLFQLIFSLLDPSLLDGAATCTICDSDDHKVCEFNFVWEG